MNEDPLRFHRHNLATDCYSASSMKVTYANRLYGVCARPSRAKRPDDDKRLPSVIIDFRAFEGPLKVEWSSHDGSQHSHVINLEDVFKGRIVLHKEDSTKIDRAMPMIPANPTIVIEVNDRTLSLFMDVHVALHPTELTAPSREVRRNRTLAYSQSF